MCTGLEIAALAGTAVSAYSAIANKPSGPTGPDPAAERAKAEAEATQNANARLRMQRKAMRDNSLLTGAGSSTLGGGAAPDAGTARKTLGV